MNLTKTNWNLGWTPNADHVGGDPNGLLRMDNLQQDDTGALVLVRPLNTLFTASGFIEIMFPININGTEYLFIATGGGAEIYRLTGPDFTSGTALFGGSARACFASCLGQVICCAGFAKNKILPDASTKSLGINKPGPPTISAVSQTTMDLGSSWTMVEGHDDFFTDSTTLILTANLAFSGDTTDSASGGYDALGDTLSLEITPHDPSLFQDIKIVIALDNLDNPTNYYWFDFGMLGLPAGVNQGIDITSNLTLPRGNFVREGGDSTLDWKTVVGLTVSAHGLTDTQMHFGDCKFVGGVKGVLNGYYQYAVQAVDDNGHYQAKSPLSLPSAPVLLLNGYVTVTPATVGVANKYFIYRRSAIITDTQVNNSIPQSNLDQWYKVGETTGAGVEDNLSDVDAIIQDITVNVYLLEPRIDITDDFIDMIGIDNGRTIYMSTKSIFLSDYLNPDAIDSRFIFNVTGDDTETNLWIKQVSNQLRVLATTHDQYEISGSLVENPDGTLDIQIRAIGEAFPPLGYEATAIDGLVYYIARDGLRGTNGGPSTNLMTGQITSMFQRYIARHGIPTVDITSGGVNPYGIAAGRGKIYCAVPLGDGTRRLFILNTQTGVWRLQYTDPISLCLTTNGKVLGGYGGGDGNLLVEIEANNASSPGGVMIYLLTVSDANGQPRNRKDTFTLKIIADTGGQPITVYIQRDSGGADATNFGEGPYITLGTITGNGEETFYFPLDASNITLGFRYSLKLTGSSLTTCRIAEITIEYEARPEQVDFLRIQQQNFGTISRKRFISFAFVIDTLGNNVTFTPVIDGVDQATSTVNTTSKTTYIHYFTDERTGIDIGGRLKGTSNNAIFEFYNIDIDKSFSEVMPAPAEHLVIPEDNFGSPDRKRATSIKFVLNTRGNNVTFTPLLDGIAAAPTTYNTTIKQTVEYFFVEDTDITFIDLGATLHTSGVTSESHLPFEYYGPLVPQQLEVLPPRLKSLFLPTTNFDIPTYKRLRTLPLSIETNGDNVDVNCVFDGTPYYKPFSVNTQGKRTVFCYFDTDVFFVDVAVDLESREDTPFEFYKLEQPLDVEVLPVPRVYDQIGPFKMDKVGKIFAIRLRLITTATPLTVNIYTEDGEAFPTYGTVTYTTPLTVVPGTDQVYEVDMPKSINPSVVRITLQSSGIFFRMDTLIKVAMSGMETDSQWVPV